MNVLTDVLKSMKNDLRIATSWEEVRDVLEELIDKELQMREIGEHVERIRQMNLGKVSRRW